MAGGDWTGMLPWNMELTWKRMAGRKGHTELFACSGEGSPTSVGLEHIVWSW